MQKQLVPKKPVAMEPRSVIQARKRINWFAEDGEFRLAARNSETIADFDVREWIENRPNNAPDALLDLEYVYLLASNIFAFHRDLKGFQLHRTLLKPRRTSL